MELGWEVLCCGDREMGLIRWVRKYVGECWEFEGKVLDCGERGFSMMNVWLMYIDCDGKWEGVK